MISNPFFLTSILISALLAFGITAALVESAIVILKIKPGRACSLMRYLPFLSLLFDLFFDSLSFGYWLNPFSCSSCMQKLMLSLFLPDLKTYLDANEISLLKYLGSEISHGVFTAGFMTFFSVVFYFLTVRLIESWLLSKRLFALMSEENISTRTIQNNALAAMIQRTGVRVYVTDEIATPMATCFKAVFLPRKVAEQFPDSEFEAVIAHEMEHMLWRDPEMKLFAHFLSALFWWVPVSSWQKKLEFDQEVACDRSIIKYGLQNECLASALVKVATGEERSVEEALCFFKSSRHPALERMEIMIGTFPRPSKKLELLCALFIVFELLIGALCTFTV